MTGIITSLGRTAYTLAFEWSPILLTGGIATNIGGVLPIIALTEGLSVISDLADLNLQNISVPFAKFIFPGGNTLIRNDFGRYPFANQTVAANAVIEQPNIVSLVMTTTQFGEAFYTRRLATMLALQSTLRQHCNQGGLFTVLTPSMIYQNCLLDSLTNNGGDVSNPDQFWQWDFEKPLLTKEDSISAQNTLLGRLTGGRYTTGTWSAATGGTGLGDLVGDFS